MKLYYHKTDGGAEYYCFEHIKDCEEGDVRYWVLRVDGDEFELNPHMLKERCIRLVINN